MRTIFNTVVSITNITIFAHASKLNRNRIGQTQSIIATIIQHFTCLSCAHVAVTEIPLQTFAFISAFCRQLTSSIRITV